MEGVTVVEVEKALVGVFDVIRRKGKSATRSGRGYSVHGVCLSPTQYTITVKLEQGVMVAPVKKG